MANAPGNVSSYNIAPGESTDAAAMRRKYAMALMQTGMSPEPVQHWAQGMARALQAGIGGYEMYGLDKADQDDKKNTRELIGLLSGGSAAGAPVEAQGGGAANAPTIGAVAPPLSLAPPYPGPGAPLSLAPPYPGPNTPLNLLPPEEKARPPATMPAEAQPPRTRLASALAGMPMGELPANATAPVGITQDVTGRTINAESRGNPAARNPRSSAAGPAQFIDSTWLETIKRARPDIAAGKSDQELLALRTDPAQAELSGEMTTAYAEQNGKVLRDAGFQVTPGTTYLAHFAGPNGARAILSADPNTSVESILGPKVIAANPFLQGMTAGDLRAWADKKMGGGAPATAQQGASPPAMTSMPAQPKSGDIEATPPIRLAQALANPDVKSDAAPIAAVNPMRGGMTPERRMAVINALMQTKAGAAIGQHLFAKELEKEQNRTRQLTDPRERSIAGIPADDLNPYQVDAQGKISPINPKPQSIQVQANTAQETAQSKGQGEYFSKLYSDTQVQGRKARSTISTLNMLDQLTHDQNFYSGIGGEPVRWIKQAFSALGGDPKAAASMENFTALSNKMVYDVLGSLGNQISNGDRSFIERIFTSLSDTVEGNRAKIQIMKRLYERQADIASEARKYNGGRLDPTYEDRIDEKYSSRPLFSDDEMKAITGTARAPGVVEQQQGVTEKTINGKTYFKKDGQWFEK